MTPTGRDPGLQEERTELAWRRTLLAIAAGALLAVRVLSDALGVAALVVGAAGLVVTATLWIAVGRRRAPGAPPRGLRAAPVAARSDGRLLAVTAAVCSCGALLGLVDLAVRTAR